MSANGREAGWYGGIWFAGEDFAYWDGRRWLASEWATIERPAPTTVLCRIPDPAELAELKQKLEAAERERDELHSGLRAAFDFYMGPSASGSFTCSCGNKSLCGMCEMRESVASILKRAASGTGRQDGEDGGE